MKSDLIGDLEMFPSDAERDSCDGESTNKDELSSALWSLQTGKSPGSGGLPTEFCLAFWDDLGDVLVVVLKDNYRLGLLSKSQREGLLRFLYKKDDKRLPKNWRPISLLNPDYKSSSKVTKERLNPVMISLVHVWGGG